MLIVMGVINTSETVRVGVEIFEMAGGESVQDGPPTKSDREPPVADGAATYDFVGSFQGLP